MHSRDARSWMHALFRLGSRRGSILGSTFFNLYINDIPRMDGCELALYADDTALFTSSWQLSMLVLRLQYYLNDIITFFETWKLQINPEKTEAILFTRRNKILSARDKHNIQIAGGKTCPGKTRLNTSAFSSIIKCCGTLPSVIEFPKPSKWLSTSTLISVINHLSVCTCALNIYKVCIRPVLTYGAQV